MLIIGAKGFAKEVLEILHQNNIFDNIAFFDDVNQDTPNFLYGNFPVLKSLEEAKHFFLEHSNQFTIGIGNPNLRFKIYKSFKKIGGNLVSTISPNSDIGHFGNSIDQGNNITSGVIITNDVTLGKGVLVNLNSTIGHDCNIGDFVEICPNVNISGNCNIGDFTFIGTSATILPNLNIGKKAIIGAGAVVTKDVPDNVLVMGIPAKIIKEIK